MIPAAANPTTQESELLSLPRGQVWTVERVEISQFPLAPSSRPQDVLETHVTLSVHITDSQCDGQMYQDPTPSVCPHSGSGGHIVGLGIYLFSLSSPRLNLSPSSSTRLRI